jgi:hypothetical protein
MAASESRVLQTSFTPDMLRIKGYPADLPFFPPLDLLCGVGNSRLEESKPSPA